MYSWDEGGRCFALAGFEIGLGNPFWRWVAPFLVAIFF
jgi:hypothetical protein